MPENQNHEFVAAPHDAEVFGTVPHDAESFRTVPKTPEPFRMVPKASERTEEHILTVRESARIFEAAGVARTERSITNWCQSNRSGVARLDAYFDSNDRKYFVTPQSVDAAIKEELAKAAKHLEPSESVGTVPNPAEEEKGNRRTMDATSDEIEELQFKLRDAEITSRAKDQYITKLEEQNNKILEQLVGFSRTIGQLETKLVQLEAPKTSSNDARRLPVLSERAENGSERL